MAFIHVLLGLLLAPLLFGIINRVKAKFGGRRGRPFLQLYYDLAKLLRKDAVYPYASTWVFWVGPILGLACLLLSLSILPLAGRAVFSFTGDFFLVAYLMGMARFCSILAALDTGSPFEGMGASREATFSALAEPVLLLSFMPLGLLAGSYSLSGMLFPLDGANWAKDWPVLLLLTASFFILLLVENCRIPADDPTTHLELTMIHEAMILDHGGVDLAFIEYAAALKMWFFAAILTSLGLPRLDTPHMALAMSLGGIVAVAVTVGIVESIMARLRMLRVPQLLAIAGALAMLACLFSLR